MQDKLEDGLLQILTASLGQIRSWKHAKCRGIEPGARGMAVADVFWLPSASVTLTRGQLGCAST